MANRRTISLRTKISAVTTLTIIVVALMLGGLNTYNQLSHIRKFEERFLRDSVRSASAISHAIMPHLVSDDFISMNNLVSYYGKRSDRLYVLVVDNNSRILAASEGGEIGGTYQSPPAYKTERTGEGTTRRFMRSGKRAVEVSYPVKAGDLIVGNVVMGLNMDWLEEEAGVIKKTMMASTGIALVVIFLGIFLTSALANRILHPIRLLTHAAEEVGRGDYSQRINVKSNDEVGLLADTFDAMLGQLRSARMQLVEKDYLDSILATMRDALIVADPEGRIEMVNKATLNLLGYREDELVTRQLRTIISDAQPGERGIEDLIRQGLIGDVEISLLSRDGRKIPVLLSRAVLENEGKVMRIVCVAKDISERNRAEEALRESEERYRSVIENVGVGISVISPNMEILSLNRTMKSWFPDIDVQGKPHCYRSFFRPPKDAICSSCPTFLTLKDGQVHEAITETVTEGKTLTHRLLSSPIRDQSGQVVAAIEMVEDITERRNLQSRLEEKTAEQNTILENTLAGIAFLKDRRFVWFNARTEQMFGYSNSEMSGLTTEAFYPSQESYEQLGKAAYPLLATGKSYTTERLMRRKDGSLFWCSLSGKAIDPSTSSKGSIWILQDIMEKKRAEEQIRASLREKEILLKEVHHRVKNNLQVVASMLNLQSRYMEDRKAKAMFEDSQRRIESMSLIHEKLYRSKDLARIDFREYIEDLLGNVTALNGGSDRLEIREDIGEVVLDVNKGIPCGLIINELVSNALRHAFPEGRKGIIEVGMQSDSSGRISLVVSDNGIGFPEHIDFRNTQSLGMQLVTSLVRQLDGTIELDKSEGTAFTITFHT